MLRNRRGKVFILILIAGLISGSILYGQERTINNPEYRPELFVILKTKVEFDLNNSLVRFEVRNARFGLRGNINNYMAYKAEIDLSDEGKMKMLDAYVRFTPIHNLDLYLGQRKIPFSTDYMRNPAENIFANRSFLTKYINDGMRDIGFFADYRFSDDLPFNLILGAVNGTGNNNPKWISRPNLVGRITAGSLTGLRIAGNVYSGESQNKKDLLMLGAELRYATSQFLIETEYITRNWTDTLSVRHHDDGLYIHSYYNFTTNNRAIHLITPTIRWDLIGNSVFRSETDASRITIGINIGFEPRQFYSEIRLNYENYFKSSLPIHTDKLTLEFIGRF